jgi:hypothetical protein
MIELYDVKTQTAKTRNKPTLQEIVNSDPFLKGDDVHLDLSSFPGLQTSPVEEFEPHGQAQILQLSCCGKQSPIV